MCQKNYLFGYCTLHEPYENDLWGFIFYFLNKIKKNLYETRQKHKIPLAHYTVCNTD